MRLWTLGPLACAIALAQNQDKPPQYIFGTTVVSTSGFEGKIYELEDGADRLPDFARRKPIGSIYTKTLNVWPQQFNEGFPGVSDRFEWFGIDYTGRIWIDEAGVYRFSLLSDDGARISVDGKVVVEMDGQHSPTGATGAVRLTRGSHDVRVSYFQGPRDVVALVVAVAAPGKPWKILDTDDFPPPKDPSEWRQGEAEVARMGTNKYSPPPAPRRRRR
ncbi:MAG: PA14 domain-containing protein [Bryobacteraceae bacterium]